MPIQLTQAEIYARGNSVRDLLSNISSTGGPAYQILTFQNSLTIIVHDGQPNQENFSNIRFKTCYRGFWANYYEIWKPIDEQQSNFNLEKAYFTLYKIDEPFYQNDEMEYICLHCDLNEYDDEKKPKSIYEKCPHLHIKVAEQPIPKAHIALATNYSDRMLYDARSITETFEATINMIKDEILAKRE